MRKPKRRRRRVTSRFYAFVCIVVAMTFLLVLGVRKVIEWNQPPESFKPVPVSSVNGNEPTAAPGGAATADPNAGALPQETADPSATADPSTTPGGPSSLDALLEDDSVFGEEADPSEQIEVKDNELSVRDDLPSEWRNILLLGQDARKDNARGRTDTMVIASINSKTGSIKLTSLMRDMIIPIPGRADNKVNSLHFFGGPNLTMKVLNEQFQLNITEYVVVNFMNFANIIEKLGGVEVDVREVEVASVNEYVEKTIRDCNKQGKDISHLDQSLLTMWGPDTHLTGLQALNYSRIRKLDNDMYRTSRQRKVLEAILKKVKKDPNPITLLSLGTEMIQYVKTNIGLQDLVGLGITVLTSDQEMKEMRLPVDDSYQSATREGTSALYDVDYEMNRNALYDFIYNQP